MNQVIPRLLVCICLLLTYSISAQTLLNTSNSGKKYISCDGTYRDDGGRSIYSDRYDTDDDDIPDFLCWTFCPTHPINEGVRLSFTEWDVVDPGDVFRIRDGKYGVCDHVPPTGLSPLIGGNGYGFTGASASQFDGSAGGAYAYGGGGWIEPSPSNASGCLTVEFRPDGDGNKGSGWTFEVECIREEGPSDLFISEYYTDCDKNLYVELYNPTNKVIDFDEEKDNDFTLRRQNGTTYGTGRYEVDLKGKIQPHSTFVVCKRRSNSTITRSCDQSVDPFGNNGALFPWIKCNEGFGLFQNGHAIDVVGDATTAASGSSLTVAGISNITGKYTLIRKKHITKGNYIWDTSSGTNEANSEWLFVPHGSYKNLDKHITGDQGIFISEFSGHDANDAYIEIYNSTNAVYSLSNIDVILAKNAQDWGATAPSGTPSYCGGWTQASANPHMLSLQGTLNPGEVYVISNAGGSPSIQCQSDLTLNRSNSAGQSALQLMNGNDAIGLFMNHVLIDVVGVPGSNRAHTVDRNSSATDRFIIVRNRDTRVGNCDFIDSSAGWGEWKLHDLEDFSLLGAHNKTAESCFQNIVITEYMNGHSTTAIGISNKSTNRIDLSRYRLKMASNGQGWGARNIDFPSNTMLAPNQEFVVYQATEGDPFTAISNNLKMKTTHFIKSDGSKYLDLDDAVGLYEINGELLDIVGDQNSSNNGVGYRIAGVNNALASNTLRRKSAIAYGNTEPMGSFGTWKNNSEWLVINNRNIEDFGKASLVDEIPNVTYDLFVETGASCEGTATAKVTIELLGGTAPFAIQVDEQEVINGTIDLLNGSYLLSIVDAYGIRYNTPIEIDAPLSASITAIVQTLQGTSCVSSADASATIISEDVELTYLWADGSTAATNNQLAAGSQNVTVTNQLGCESILEVAIEAGPGVNASLQMMQAPSCAGIADAVANVTSTETNLTYVWSDGTTTALNNQLVTGSHSVTVTNIAGCSQVLAINMEAPTGIAVTASLTKDLTCANTNDASATVSGTGTYQYAWSNGSTTATVNNLGTGTHTVTVTNLAGCSQALAVNVAAPNTITATANVVKNLTCVNSNDASATVSTTSGSDTYQYAWSNGTTTATVNNLNAGTHIVTVTNSAGCSQAFAVNVTAPNAITATATILNNLSCTSTNNASATITASGGTGTYQYAWSNGTNTATVNNLSAGTHSVTVTDNNACATVSTITVAQQTAMSVQATLTQPSCSQNTGSIQVTPVGGTGPYLYNWNNAGFTQGQTTLSNVASGNYTVDIQDNNGCTYSESFVLETATSIEASIQNITPTTCKDSNNGQAQIISNQTDVEIVWDNGIVGNSNTQLSTGNHTVTIRNNNGCSQTIEFTIEDAPIITASINLTKGLSCHGEIGAVATISAQGGSGKYEFYWSNGTIGTMNNNLQAGTYIVTILDEVGCNTTNTFVVEQPTALALTATIEEPICSATPSGSILAIPTGGVAPYQYNWNNSDYTAESSITGLSGGSHTLSIKDANGCTFTETFNLTTPSNLEVAIDNITAPTCSNSNNGTAQVSTSATELSFQWSDGSTAAINTNLSSGNHSVTVSNAAGCSQVLRIELPAPTLINVAVANTQAATCSSSTGQAIVTVTGGQGPYTYLWDNGQTTPTANSLTAGSHQVKVVDANGCSVDYELSIDAVAEVKKAQVEALICNGSSYATATNNYTEPGVYTESSLTANGCDSITTIILSVLENPSINLGADQIIRSGETIELSPTGTFMNYLWSTGSTHPSIVIQADDLEVGANWLKVIVTDNAGCEATAQVVIFFEKTTNLNDPMEQTTATIDPVILKNIHFYPNPSNGLVNVIDQNEVLAETIIEAYTPQGQLVKSWNFDRLQTAQLDLQNLTNAVYILKIVRAEKVGFQKVLLNR